MSFVKPHSAFSCFAVLQSENHGKRSISFRFNLKLGFWAQKKETPDAGAVVCGVKAVSRSTVLKWRTAKTRTVLQSDVHSKHDIQHDIQVA